MLAGHHTLPCTSATCLPLYVAHMTRAAAALYSA